MSVLEGEASQSFYIWRHQALDHQRHSRPTLRCPTGKLRQAPQDAKACRNSGPVSKLVENIEMFMLSRKGLWSVVPEADPEIPVLGANHDVLARLGGPIGASGLQGKQGIIRVSVRPAFRGASGVL
jgi:hypothetical protein